MPVSTYDDGLPADYPRDGDNSATLLTLLEAAIGQTITCGSITVHITAHRIQKWESAQYGKLDKR